MGKFPYLPSIFLGILSFSGGYVFTILQMGVITPPLSLAYFFENSTASLPDAMQIDSLPQDAGTPPDSRVADEGVPVLEVVEVRSEAIVETENATIPTNTLIEYARTPNVVWEERTASAPWAARDSGASFVFNDRLWFMGGLNGDGLPGEDHVVKYWEATYFNDIWSSVDGSVWQKEHTSASWSPRRSMTVGEIGGTLFMYGGWSQTEGYVRDMWYSVDGYTWKQAATSTPWSPREGQTLEFFDNKLWLIGGVNYDERKVFNDTWYSEDGLNWIEAPMGGLRWNGRWDHATAVFNDELYLVGGMNLNKETFGDIWKTRDGMEWVKVGVLPGLARQGHGLVSYNDALWTIGRLNDNEGGGENDIWYSEDGVVWNKTESLPPWIGREDHAVHVFNNAIYVYGGMSSEWEWKNDVWRGELLE